MAGEMAERARLHSDPKGHGQTVHWIEAVDADLEDLAAGSVPPLIVAMARAYLDWEQQQTKHAKRPVKRGTPRPTGTP